MREAVTYDMVVAELMNLLTISSLVALGMSANLLAMDREQLSVIAELDATVDGLFWKFTVPAYIAMTYASVVGPFVCFIVSLACLITFFDMNIHRDDSVAASGEVSRRPRAGAASCRVGAGPAPRPAGAGPSAPPPTPPDPFRSALPAAFKHQFRQEFMLMYYAIFAATFCGAGSIAMVCLSRIPLSRCAMAALGGDGFDPYARDFGDCDSALTATHYIWIAMTVGLLAFVAFMGFWFVREGLIFRFRFMNRRIALYEHAPDPTVGRRARRALGLQSNRSQRAGRE